MVGRTTRQRKLKGYTNLPGESCLTIANTQGVSVDLLKRINPGLNCASVQPNLQLCVNRFSQWALVNCRQTYIVWDGDTCASIVARFAALLPYGMDDFLYYNPGVNCAYLLRGMLTCVSGV
ncbi:hypothetical protein TSOC_009102 [Tetrabaena socialis]|uniref:LysM domain-containing protein n=1 Tax=Tetrabaena socialis TaxID=47790 RepID=A0A2J7ZWQ7_9CHLO|nr:hypothetical protein TSOC_009102 [Tetrabaena socialis]|eukprot:PNH04699.1 hypothetical protein TSOC_009102 [Tetrabaena socialis]